MSFCAWALALSSNSRVADFGLGKLLLDLLGVGLSVGNPFATLLQHVDDRTESVGFQDKEHDAEREHLRDEGGPVQTKNLRDAFFGDEGEGGHDWWKGFRLRGDIRSRLVSPPAAGNGAGRKR